MDCCQSGLEALQRESGTWHADRVPVGQVRSYGWANEDSASANESFCLNHVTLCCHGNRKHFLCGNSCLLQTLQARSFIPVKGYRLISFSFFSNYCYDRIYNDWKNIIFEVPHFSAVTRKTSFETLEIVLNMLLVGQLPHGNHQGGWRFSS